MEHRQESPSGGDGRPRRPVLLIVGLVVGVLAFAGTGTFLGHLMLRGSPDQLLEEKRGEAARRAMLIHNAYVRYQSEHGEWPASMSDTLKPGGDGVPYLEGGQSSLYDPWGRQFQVEVRPDASGKPQPVVWTEDPRGRRVGFPTD
jgi:hypothetical protein